MGQRLRRKWRVAQQDLGIELDESYEVDLGNGTRVRSDVRVRHFGAREGMLVTTDYAIVKPHIARLQSLGYGFSVMDEPDDPVTLKYDRHSMIDVLRDWGWTGPANTQPAWL